MHTILGAGGPVANSLASVLTTAGESVRLVSRKKIETSGKSSWVRADLKDPEQVRTAVNGSTVIYMCAGLRYDKEVWAREWPLIMQNLIEAGKSTGARIIFFDNVYMYGKVTGVMTEETPYNPSSKKGEIRARISEQLMHEAKLGNINATIARAADFYGAESLNSFYDSMVLIKYAKKQKAMWLGNTAAKHSFTYVPDTGKALYLLANDAGSKNQVWHVPTAPALTGKEFIELAARIFNVQPEYVRINKLLLHTIGVFNKLIRETAEMYYQYQYDYIFSSQKFETTYKIRPTAYADGILQLSQTLFRPTVSGDLRNQQAVATNSL
jgi:nucleoside-diphosphate-sugar epimerase